HKHTNTLLGAFFTTTHKNEFCILLPHTHTHRKMFTNPHTLPCAVLASGCDEGLSCSDLPHTSEESHKQTHTHTHTHGCKLKKQSLSHKLHFHESNYPQ